MRSLLTEYEVVLDIDIETYQANPTLLNQFVKPDTKIKSMKWGNIGKFNEDTDDIEEVKDEELDAKCYEEKEIRIISNGQSETFHQKDGYTARDLFNCIIALELKARPETDWFGGIDAHHIFFEGLYHMDGTTYQVYWGS